MDISPSALFSSLAHETRLRCLMLLCVRDELCVCELTAVIGAAQPHISRHLAQLREAGLVADRRDGQWIHYRLHPEMPDWIARVIEQTCAGVREQVPFADDLVELDRCSREVSVVARCG